MVSDCLYLSSGLSAHTPTQTWKAVVMVKVAAHIFQKALYRSTEICLGGIRRAILGIKISVTGDQQDINSHFPWIPTTREANTCEMLTCTMFSIGNGVFHRRMSAKNMRSPSARMVSDFMKLQAPCRGLLHLPRRLFSWS